MRGILIGLALLIGALAANPAAAQDAGALQWLMGKWCADTIEQGKICLTYTPNADGTIANEWASQSTDVERPEHSEAVMRIVDGRVTLHSDDQDSDFREVARGPNLLVLETTQEDLPAGSVLRVSHRREGDELVLDMVLVGGEKATNRYKREN